jgi:EpsI family protein
MNIIRIKALLTGFAMIAAAVLTIALTPTKLTATTAPKIDLETMIPKQFGNWTLDSTIDDLTVNPDVQSNLDRIYSQTLSRTYINQQGDHIMLSIAYGNDQTGRLRVHRPEVCYAAQGFYVTKTVQDKILVGQVALPVVRTVATQINRIEPITYWMTVGKSVVTSSITQRLQQLRYGLSGEIPDGMIFRVSSIDSDQKKAYLMQSIFINDLMKHVHNEDKIRILGTNYGQGK